MRSTFAYFSVFQNENLVRAANGSETVGDDESSSTNHEVSERLLHEHFGLRVQLRRGLVENKNGRVF